MSSLTSWLRRCWRPTAVLLALPLFMAGCGGGGGGGSGSGGAIPGPAAPPPATAATLMLKQTTAGPLAQQVPRKAEVPLTVGQFAGELAQRFSKKGGPLSLAENCSGGSGQLNIVLTDRDGDGIASGGDRIAASFDHCIIGLFGDGLIGSLVVDLSAPTALATGTVNGVVRLEGTLALPHLQQIWSGSFKIAMTRSDLARSWTVTSSADDDLRVATSGGPVDYLRSLMLSKSVDYERARNAVDLRLRYETPDGTVLVSTPTPFGGYLQRAPDTGVMEMQGANAKARVTAAKGTSTVEAHLEFVPQSGAAELLSRWPWYGLTKGFLWWDGQARDLFSNEADLNTNEYAVDFLSYSLLAPEPSARTAAAAIFRLQFHRPPVDLPQLTYRFSDVSVIDAASSAWDIPANAERHGALLLVRPAQPLRHGHEYMLEASVDGVTWNIPNKFLAPDILLHDAEGHELKLHNGSIGGFSTPDSLRAAIETDFDSLPTAAAQVMLTAATQPSAGRSIVRYHWSQVSGSPLRFSAPDSASSGLSWGSSVPSGIEFVQVQLEVTDSAGDTETTRRTIGVGNVMAQPTFLVLRGAGVLYGRNPEYYYDLPVDLYFGPVFQPSLLKVSFQSLDRRFPPARLTLATPAGVPFKVGTYAIAGGEATSTVAPDLVLQRLADLVCTTRTGQFEIREVALGANGVPTRLAVDFQHSCNGSPLIFGSYRLNSALPVAP